VVTMVSAKLMYVIEMVVAIYFIGYLLPPPLINLLNATTWGNIAVQNPAVYSILTILLPMLIVLGLGLALMPEEIKTKIGI
jgi:hypothetical protein